MDYLIMNVFTSNDFAEIPNIFSVELDRIKELPFENNFKFLKETKQYEIGAEFDFDFYNYKYLSKGFEIITDISEFKNCSTNLESFYVYYITEGSIYFKCFNKYTGESFWTNPINIKSIINLNS